MCCKHVFTFFFFNDTATTEIYTLSLHDALPIFYQKNLDEGVAGFWNDMNEPGVFLSDETPKPDIYHHPMKTFPLTARHAGEDRKSTRLNSSHANISYAVFCLKKKIYNNFRRCSI